MKVVKTDGLMPVSPAHLDLFRDLDVDLVEQTCLTEDALIASCADADALLVLREPITARVIAELRNCRIIARFGIGLDTINVEAATAAGIAVANVPDANIDEVSTHALALMLNFVRRLSRLDATVRQGRWEILEPGRGMTRPDKMILGLIGFGRIGRLVAQKALPFGFRVIAHDPQLQDEAISSLGVDPVGFGELMTRSDIVSLHIPLTSGTYGLIGREVIRSMKRGAIFINVSRGGLVDEMALAEALHTGQIGFAAIDAFAREPLEPTNPLLSAPNTVLSPHAAHYSEQSLEECILKAFLNVAVALRGARAPYQVNDVAVRT